MCELFSSRGRGALLATGGTSRALDLVCTIAAGLPSDTQRCAKGCASRTMDEAFCLAGTSYSLTDRVWRRRGPPRSSAGLKQTPPFSVRRESVAIAGHCHGGGRELDRRDMDEIASAPEASARKKNADVAA